MKDLKGTKTAENLAKAFAGESQARNRYTFYSKAARDEGHIHISDVFTETAENERAHARIFFDFLMEGLGKDFIKVDADYPIGFGKTVDNLQYAAEGEKEEWGTVYPSFAETAKSEGFPQIEAAIKRVIEIETVHEKRYLDLLSSLQNGTLYKRESPQNWYCINCGYIYQGNEAPKACPACKFPQGYFKIMYNNMP